VIVKKVQTNKAAAPKSKALHARDLCDYIAGPNAGDEDEKVEHRGAVNILNIDHDAQVQEIADLAETAKRAPQPVQHWIISWRQGEQPTAAQADRAVRIFLEEMGLGEHQALYALHRNTDNYHLHLAINRVHPESERLVTVNGGFDIEVAHRAIAHIEHDQGWQPERGARYRVLEDGGLKRAEDSVPAERPPRTPARDFEDQTGQKSAQRIAIEEGAELIRRARSWGDLHARLAERGMRFERKGSGAILWVGETAVKASTAGRDCSMAALEKRLGDFLPPMKPALTPRRLPDPVVPTAPGWTEYISSRQDHYASKKREREQLGGRQRAEWERMTARHRDERQRTLGGSWRGKREALNAVRSMMAARQAQEKAAVRERQVLERAAWRERFPRWPGFEDWLRERAGPELAEQWRFRERIPAVIMGDKPDPARPRDIRAFVAEARGSQVLYRRAGAPHSPASFSDRGRLIQVYDLNRDSVLAALQLSAQKWGTIQVLGSAAYKRLCVELAAEHGFRITNPELEKEIAAERERRRRPAPPSPGQEGRARFLIPTAHPRGSRSAPDPPPVRDQVERAIRDGAAKLRPHEQRKWDEYAARACAHAFGASAAQDLRDLEKTRDALLRLEGRARSQEPSLDMSPRRGPELGR
jgi:Relaxase/Mobilisation nuclease domain/Large polyvalent protein-associated domain 7